MTLRFNEWCRRCCCWCFCWGSPVKKTDPLCLNWSPLSKAIFILRRKSSNKKISNLKQDYLGTTHVKARRGDIKYFCSFIMMIIKKYQW